MSHFLRAFFLVAFALSGVSAKAGDKWHFREVLFEVRDPDGKLAPGVKVHLMGVDRFAMGPDDYDNKNWNFVTGTKGCFTARFGDFRSIDYEEKTHEEMPGYGGFYMVAEFPGTAGGVSPYLRNVKKKGDQLLSDGWTEWQKGEFAPAPVNVAKPPKLVVIQLKRGITITGSVRDMDGNPIANCQIGTLHDLHATTHTGFGAEMLPARAYTNADGIYRIEHVYPNRFDIEQPCGVWIKTRVRSGHWKEERIDEITPRTKEKEIRVDLVVVKEPPYRYFGKVTDAQGQPVPNAKVTLGVSLHWPCRTYGDDHHFENATTDSKGEYELYVKSRFVRGFMVEAPGFKNGELQWIEDGTSYAPSSYNFQLSK